MSQSSTEQSYRGLFVFPLSGWLFLAIEAVRLLSALAPFAQNIFHLSPSHISQKDTTDGGSVWMPGLRDYRADLLQRWTLSGLQVIASHQGLILESYSSDFHKTLCCIQKEQSRHPDILKSLRQLRTASVADTSNGSKVLANIY